MYQTDFEDFQKTMVDLCMSVNRPCNDNLVRVFWEDLKDVPFGVVKARSKLIRITGKKDFRSNDLRAPPEDKTQVITGPSLADQLATFVLRHKSLSKNQIRAPWKWLGTKEGIVTGVEIPPDGENRGYRVMIEDMQLGRVA